MTAKLKCAARTGIVIELSSRLCFSKRRDLAQRTLHANPGFMMAYFVYILASKPFGVFYVGVTSDLLGRIYQHKQGMLAGFTKKYNVKMLVYYEMHTDIEQAILREKSLKRWTRQKKIIAIEEMNPTWIDLYETIA